MAKETLGGIGVALGLVGASVATFWGGYEVGSVINDYIGITSTVGRGAVDIVTMGIIAAPAYRMGIFGGAAVGGVVGGLVDIIRS